MPLECLPVAMLYVSFHRTSANDFKQTSKSRFSPADVTQSDRFEVLTKVWQQLSHCVRRYWSKFCLIPLIKGKTNTANKADDSKERLGGGLNEKCLAGRLWRSRNMALMDNLIKVSERKGPGVNPPLCDERDAWWEVRLTCCWHPSDAALSHAMWLPKPRTKGFHCW